MDAVLDASHGKSVLLITHRPEGLDRMDEVVRIDGGAILRGEPRRLATT